MSTDSNWQPYEVFACSFVYDHRKETEENFSFSLALTAKAKAMLKINLRGKKEKQARFNFNVKVWSAVGCADHESYTIPDSFIIVFFLYAWSYWWLRCFVASFKLHKEAHRTSSQIYCCTWRRGIWAKHSLLCNDNSDYTRDRAEIKLVQRRLCDGDECTSSANHRKYWIVWLPKKGPQWIRSRLINVRSSGQ